MIDNELYAQILEKGLTLDHFFILCCMKTQKPLPQTSRIQGFINLLTKKGYINNEGELTEEGKTVVGSYEYKPEEKVPEYTSSAEQWCMRLHGRCQDKLFELTGKKQAVGQIEKQRHSFLPNAVDLTKQLTKVISLYKLKDFAKIEETIMKYITQCADTKSWFPVLGYYIMKNGASRLVTDMENDEESDESSEYRSTQKFL